MTIPSCGEPAVSIIIPVYNNVTLTARCLNAVSLHTRGTSSEVIVVDDASTDGTAAYLASCSGIRTIRHEANQGFVASANGGAAVARAAYMCFLNNDTIVLDGWLTKALETFEGDESVGAVGSKLLSPDGTISEAGGIIWNDGSGANYARGLSATRPGVSFTRDADYCSAACLIVRSDLFRELGGFSTHYAPAYYEDVDLCFRLRASGRRVIYQPNSAVVHFEGRTAGTNTSAGIKRYQEINRHKFLNTWRHELSRHYPPGKEFTELAARRLAGKRTALVMDSFVPFADRSAGARRLAAIIDLMRGAGWHVIFVADDGNAYEPYTSRLRTAGVEVIPHRGDANSTIRALPVPIDLAWICRPELMRRYAQTVRSRTRARIIYDTVDLHFVRLEREQSVSGRKASSGARDLELAMAALADHTVVTSANEQEILRDLGIASSVVPIIERASCAQTNFAARRDVLFVGNYTHAPNADAAKWLAERIMPLVWERLPEARLILAGAEPTPAVKRLATNGIVVTGFVPDLKRLYDQARVFAAAVRYGAGVKGKVVASLAYGLPVVATSVGAEGMNLRAGVDVLLADDANAFAAALVDLYTDPALWTALSRAGIAAAQKFAPESVAPLLRDAIERAVTTAELAR